jgi:Trk K+ transport system NAD-binding subunit
MRVAIASAGAVGRSIAGELVGMVAGRPEEAGA